MREHAQQICAECDLIHVLMLQVREEDVEEAAYADESFEADKEVKEGDSKEDI